MDLIRHPTPREACGGGGPAHILWHMVEKEGPSKNWAFSGIDQALGWAQGRLAGFKSPLYASLTV